jgi:hypothetical protein
LRCPARRPARRPPRSARRPRGSAAFQSSPRSAATVAATWLCVTSAQSFRSPSAGVSGPSTAIQILSETGTFSPWFFHSIGASPRP